MVKQLKSVYHYHLFVRKCEEIFNNNIGKYYIEKYLLYYRMFFNNNFNLLCYLLFFIMFCVGNVGQIKRGVLGASFILLLLLNVIQPFSINTC